MRRTTLRQLVVKLDPNWVRDSRRIREYVFGGGRGEQGGKERVFEANYRNRGAYAEE